MEQKQRPLGRPRQNKTTISTKDKIVNIATKLFLSKGYQIVSMDDVAKECDVTKATVYYYYATKADLFTDTMVQMMVRIRENMDKILSTKKPLKERLLHVAQIHLTATIDIDIKSFMRDAKISLSDKHLKQMQDAEDKMYEILAQTIDKSIKQGEIPKNHSLLSAHAFVALLYVGGYRDVNQKPLIPNIEDFAKQIVDFYWNGLSKSAS
ncbi:TetR family transcriptional regulator [Bacillus pseudomycoides]|uniref:TetR family transcriptional regulator n=1 Tax=Bacillus pseudomycoides TaxID=64104 RepID=A0AA91VFH3_9BACI|nr:MULTISPECIES: TetR/AcrR family transcriptional regulator [Bacillus]PEB52218.1 TetR family transcriptional regulator [Bacillus sp. AFS098217]PED84104.1 TetR family transcriptional regulator [Bacillus pseudomycoides]PEU06366.1 TetR family transcriptional regulator [Bacillus sp. AFS019443]PEU18709.1 TetR family transcriptional regulator [Bacillus sp. AFS014408]PFW57878.1 TetR family transcriptional regulator [Bacillus sp. AFS075034]